MSWLKIDDQFPDHPKIVEAGPLASWLHVCGMAYCARYLTDGFIPADQVSRLANLSSPHNLSAKLVRVALWEPVSGGFQICDWLGCYIAFGGITQELRHSADYVRWRRAVLKRDKSTCQSCASINQRLHVHHILPWATHPMVRYVVRNGITLCVACHERIHYGRRRCPGGN